MNGTCDWVATQVAPNGWCKFNIVPVLIRASGEANEMYKEAKARTADEEVVEKDSPNVNNVHVDAVGTFVGSSRRKKKSVPAEMTVVDQVNPEVMQDANLMQKSEEVITEIPNQIKKNAELRYTLGPWYVPNRADAHGEWTDPEELQKALWGYVENGDRDIRLQHNVEIVAGKWVEALTWPHEVEVPMMKADTGEITKQQFPAGTVFLGVQWEPWAWDLVKKGEIRGYSIGGTGAGVEVDLPTEYDNPATFPNR
jgi:hypothetical protein